MRRPPDAFSSCHPLVNFGFFGCAIGWAMLFLHPLLTPVSLIVALAYAIYLNGARAVRFSVFGLLPLMIFAAVLNPLFNHAGVTILFYLDFIVEEGNPVTLESLVFGLLAAVMLVTVISWFSSYNAVMTSDKFIYLFGRVIPALSLVFSMALRFVPRFAAQARAIARAQQGIGRSIGQGNILRRARQGIAVVSILVTWALENAIETADSMRSRGYGLKGRTAFSIFRLDGRDRILLIALGAAALTVTIGALAGVMAMKIFPAIVLPPLDALSVAVYAVYALFLVTPLALDIIMEVKWRAIMSRA
ncbi:MAG: energy-coupling factor transporter transmembrane protein EcfT [Propionibacteriaceae bacterium]|jgi:energy-coupling factor transport system permease protein|nr:energy-coupling factor transporter transmembrane protein EcfT [Propionibacteriaceae bacterium]